MLTKDYHRINPNTDANEIITEVPLRLKWRDIHQVIRAKAMATVIVTVATIRATMLRKWFVVQRDYDEFDSPFPFSWCHRRVRVSKAVILLLYSTKTYATFGALQCGASGAFC